MSSENITFNWTHLCSRTPIASCQPITVEYVDAHLDRSTLVLIAEVDDPAPSNSRLACTLRFEFDPMWDDASVERAVDRVIERVMNTIAFFEGVVPERPSGLRSTLHEVRLRHEQRLAGNSGGIGVTSLFAMTCRVAGTITHPFARNPDKLQDQLRRVLERPADEPLMRAYRAAVESTDRAAEFLLLYAILQIAHGDNQAKIDRRIDSQKLMRSLSKKSKDGETPYTRVRNELSHPGDRKRALHECVAEAESLIGRLREIVREDIVKHLGIDC